MTNHIFYLCRCNRLFTRLCGFGFLGTEIQKGKESFRKSSETPLLLQILHTSRHRDSN